MKIMIPINEDKITVCPVFARTPYFMVKDMETGSANYLINPASEAEGGAGVKAAQFVLDQNIDVLITLRLGENSAEVLKTAGISIYKSNGLKIEENLSKFKDNKLSELTSFHAGYHGV